MKHHRRKPFQVLLQSLGTIGGDPNSGGRTMNNELELVAFGVGWVGESTGCHVVSCARAFHSIKSEHLTNLSPRTVSEQSVALPPILRALSSHEPRRNA